ncbi:hypothetical protein I4U23_004361 [Adineta vaga]|nr:hypothetical protein I4U23_004361 [Adineta vaga]
MANLLIIPFRLPDLPLNELPNRIVYCSTFEEIRVALASNNTSNTVIICTPDELYELSFLNNGNWINMVYVLHTVEDTHWEASNNWNWDKTKIVHSCLSEIVSIIIYQLSHLATTGLTNPVIHCSTLIEFQAALTAACSPPPIVVSLSDQCAELDILTNGIPMTEVYILCTEANFTLKKNTSRRTDIKIVYSEKELMRHLCMKSMLSFYQHAIKYKNSGDMATGNLFARYALNSLKYTAEFE